jgi:type II secretory pathway component GspD/PulD (secretin)
MSRRMFAVLLVTAALVSPETALASEPKWPAGPYKYMVIDQDVKGVLTEFGRNIGVPVDLSDQVKGRLRGRLAVATAREFLDRLCESYGLVWYFDGAVLHVNARAEIRTELISIGRLPAAEVSEKLNALGIADSRFPVRSTQDAGVVSVSGPPPFVSLVRQTLTALAPPPPVREDSHGDEIRVRVFRGGAMLAPQTSLASRASSRPCGAG